MNQIFYRNNTNYRIFNKTLNNKSIVNFSYKYRFDLKKKDTTRDYKITRQLVNKKSMDSVDLSFKFN